MAISLHPFLYKTKNHKKYEKKQPQIDNYPESDNNLNGYKNITHQFHNFILETRPLGASC